MSECKEHIGNYAESAWCWVCLKGYWEMEYERKVEQLAAANARADALREELVASRQDCADRFDKVLAEIPSWNWWAKITADRRKLIRELRRKLKLETARADAAEKLVELVRYELRVTSDDYAPDSMPFEVADVVGRIEQTLDEGI